MFSIRYGYTEFEQWEQWCALENPHMSDGDRVFFRSANGATFTMRAEEGMVYVPNRLLQIARPFVVELEGHPECTTQFRVVEAPKPDYYELEDNTAPVPPFVGTEILCVQFKRYRDEDGNEVVECNKTSKEIWLAMEYGAPIMVTALDRVVSPNTYYQRLHCDYIWVEMDAGVTYIHFGDTTGDSYTMASDGINADVVTFSSGK